MLPTLEIIIDLPIGHGFPINNIVSLSLSQHSTALQPNWHVVHYMLDA